MGDKLTVMLSSCSAVELALTRYTDPLQLRTSSVAALEERQELARRMAWLNREEAVVLFRWYVEGAKPTVIASGLGCGLRHVYRRRTSGIEAIVALGQTESFADADVDEFDPAAVRGKG